MPEFDPMSVIQLRKRIASIEIASAIPKEFFTKEGYYLLYYWSRTHKIMRYWCGELKLVGDALQFVSPIWTPNPEKATVVPTRYVSPILSMCVTTGYFGIRIKAVDKPKKEE